MHVRKVQRGWTLRPNSRQTHMQTNHLWDPRYATMGGVTRTTVATSPVRECHMASHAHDAWNVACRGMPHGITRTTAGTSPVGACRVRTAPHGTSPAGVRATSGHRTRDVWNVTQSPAGGARHIGASHVRRPERHPPQGLCRPARGTRRAQPRALRPAGAHATSWVSHADMSDRDGHSDSAHTACQAQFWQWHAEPAARRGNERGRSPAAGGRLDTATGPAAHVGLPTPASERTAPPWRGARRSSPALSVGSSGRLVGLASRPATRSIRPVPGVTLPRGGDDPPAQHRRAPASRGRAPLRLRATA